MHHCIMYVCMVELRAYALCMVQSGAYICTISNQQSAISSAYDFHRVSSLSSSVVIINHIFDVCCMTWGSLKSWSLVVVLLCLPRAQSTTARSQYMLVLRRPPHVQFNGSNRPVEPMPNGRAVLQRRDMGDVVGGGRGSRTNDWW